MRKKHVYIETPRFIIVLLMVIIKYFKQYTGIKNKMAAQNSVCIELLKHRKKLDTGKQSVAASGWKWREDEQHCGVQGNFRAEIGWYCNSGY